MTRKTLPSNRINNGRLIQIGQSFRINQVGPRYAVFICECGVTKIICVYSVKIGDTISCGCFNKEKTIARNIKHNKCKTPEYTAWGGMKARISINNKSGKKNYVDRNITCCDRWKRFENFLEDMGQRPSPEHSIDRINNDGNYCKENCRWATDQEQSQNRRSNINLTFNNKTQCSLSWASELGINYGTLRSRLKVGWSIEKALTYPVRPIKR